MAGSAEIFDVGGKPTPTPSAGHGCGVAVGVRSRRSSTFEEYRELVAQTPTTAARRARAPGLLVLTARRVEEEIFYPAMRGTPIAASI